MAFDLSGQAYRTFRAKCRFKSGRQSAISKIMKIFRSLVAVWVVTGLSAGACLELSAASGFPAGAPTARGSLISPAFAGGAPAGSISQSECAADRTGRIAGIPRDNRIPVGDFSDARIADAIRLAEGKTAGAYRYGIRSARSEAEGRRRCIATIRANRTRWTTAGARGEFIDFLADRYCPPSVDPVGNRNWKRNVNFFLNQK